MPNNPGKQPVDPFEGLPLGPSQAENGVEETEGVTAAEATPVLEAPDGALIPLMDVAQSPKSAERWIQGMSTLRTLSIRECRPSDFIKKRTSTDEVIVDLVARGARKIMSTMLIESQPKMEPQIYLEDDGTRTAYVTGGGICYINRMRCHHIYASRNEAEEFVGRKVRRKDDGTETSTQAIALGDLKKAARKLFDRLVVEALLGIGGIPADELRSHYGIDPDLVPEGTGFGSADDRRGQKVAEEGVKEKAEKLWQVLLQITGGAQPEARDLLREITKGTKPHPQTGRLFPGHDSIGRLTLHWQVDSAISRLKQRPEYLAHYQEKTQHDNAD